MLPLYLQAIMAPLQEDEQLALATIYEDYRPTMLKICWAYLENETDAEDAVHNAVLAIARNINKVKKLQKHQLSAYVTLSAKSAAINLYRQRYNRNPLPLPKKTFSTPSMAAEVATDNAYELVLKFIRALPPQYADPLTLHLTTDLRVCEIAVALGRPLSTVKTQLRRGQKILQKQFGEMLKK